jgi:hypothetical protein
MRPPERKKTDYEKVEVDTWINGIIEKVEYDPEHKTNFKDEETGEEKIISAVRFKFKLDGYQYPHYSRWGTFSYHEKSNLFKKYLVSLVEGAQPDMDLDLDVLNGFPIKTMWGQNGEYQNLEMVRPIGAKIDTKKVKASDDVPF